MTGNSVPASGKRTAALSLPQAAALILAIAFAFPAAFSRQNVLAEQRHSAADTEAPGPDIESLQKGFIAPPPDCRIMMRWWWFGPAVTKPELEREMNLMKDGGIGGFEVQPVYPVALDDTSTGIRTLPFLSDEFIEVLRFTSEKAKQLGLRMDLTLGSGWPYGGPRVPVSQAAGKLRIQRVPVKSADRRVPIPDIVAGEKLLAVYLARVQDKSIIGENIKELVDAGDGTVPIPPGLEGPHEVLFFISSHTGQMVKRAAIGAEGFVLDHYDRAAVENYLKTVGDRLMQAFGPRPPYAIFCDSLEVYESDWTGDFLDEFRKRRGYDLRPHLPALVADVGPETTAIRHDWGETLTELLNERFIAPLRDWAHRNQTRFRFQGYGIPPATLSSNALADLPEGEGAQWKVLRASRWASSADHLYGRPVTSSETWTWLHSPSFRATPLDVKAEADLHFLQGINQLIGHGWPYSAPGAEYPGWRFYAAAVFDEKNPWWIVMPDLSLYLQRISYLLRQGQPVNDAALYLPDDDAWASFSSGGHVNMIETLGARIGPDVVGKVLESGFNFDFFDDEALQKIGTVEGSTLALGKSRYKMVILPNVERIPLATLKKLEEYARGGGILIATRRFPALAPGFKATEAEHNEIRSIAGGLFEGGSAPAHFIRDESRELPGRLNSLARPDMLLSPSVPDIGFVHRSIGEVELYFIANTGNTGQSVKATFRVQGKKSEWWDPISGRVSPAIILSETNGGITVQLNLEAYGSRVLAFSKRTLPAPKAEESASTALPPLDLSNGWQVSFGRDGKATTVENLKSWTDDEQTRYFSGQAVYEKSVIIPDSLLENGVRTRLEFGEVYPVPGRRPESRMQAWLDAPVREAAVITVNGRRAGSIWCPPYSLDVTGLLARGSNTFRVVVANLAINHMAGRALPDYRLLNLRYGVRFEPQDMKGLQPVPAGLRGPIRLIPTR
jgi:hypothetical protein